MIDMAKNKILYCATVDYHLKAFHLPYMRWFKELGWDVEVATAGNLDLPYTDHKYNIPIHRSPFHRSNIVAYKQLKAIIHGNNYSIIHCHTPLGGVLGRLVARKARKHGSTVIYTAHGFHFYEGAPLINWFLYYPIEKVLSRFTDSLITINTEDYRLAVKRKFKANEIVQIPGVGVDTDTFKPVAQHERILLKRSFGYNENDFLLFYAAEFNKNKNQKFLLHSLSLLKDDIPNAKLLLAGEGSLLEDCRKLANKLGISHMVDFLGFRQDIYQILSMCDLAVASSYREGLPVAVMEAMACGLPVVAVDNRGHRELIRHNYNGWLNSLDDPQGFANKISKIAKETELRTQFGKNGRKLMETKYSTRKILLEKSRIYKQYMNEQGEAVWLNKNQ